MEHDLKTDDLSASDIAPAIDATDAASCAANDVTVLVCLSCRKPGDPDSHPRPGSKLAAATEQAANGTGIAVARVGCLGNCKRGISAAMLREGSWSYVFGELNEDSAGDLIAGALLYAGAADGFMPFRARPEALKRGLIARIPTFAHLGSFGITPNSAIKPSSAIKKDDQ